MESQLDIEPTPVQTVANGCNYVLAYVGHYLLVTAYFRYGMLVASKFTIPSNGQEWEHKRQRILVHLQDALMTALIVA